MKRLPVSLGVVMIAAAASSPAHATPVIRHVPADFSTIQSALNASSLGDIVLVAPGTYLENLTIGPGQNGVALRSEAGPGMTIIDGGQIGRVIDCLSVGLQTSIEGFSIVNGRVGSNEAGAGLRLEYAHIRLVGNIVRNNQGGAGAGLYVDYSEPQIINNQIIHNQALGSAGGIYCDHGSHAIIEGNIIADNTALHYGGGISIWVGSSPIIMRNTIIDNEGTLNGGGIFINRNSHPMFSRNIIAFNGLGNGIRVDDFESTVELDCNDLWSNAPANYAGLPDQTGLNGNISGDPLFCDLVGRDLRLDEHSPCAPANSPTGCGLIGALDVGCGVVVVEPATWGAIKARQLTERPDPAKTAEAKEAAAR